MNINNIFNNENFIENFYKFDVSSRPVVVLWGGKPIHEITGPTPFVDISKSFNSNEAGVVESIVHTVNLTGKIMKPDFKGISNVVSGINALENLFKACEIASLEIQCDNESILKATGVQIKNISFNKTQDNWVQSAEYAIDLEYKTGPTDDPEDQVEDRNDSWSIEPLDDAVYTKFIKSISQKPETLNPEMLPIPPTEGSPVPATAVQGGLFSGSSLQIFNVPQFRITRRLSAKGITKPIESTTEECLSSSKSKEEQKKYFLSAKAWVDAQTRMAFNGISASGSLFFTNNPSISEYKGTWLYNHTRTISLDVYNATYEANDTWIAMPTGIPYTETFTVETSTDQENIKTVTVAGNIQGLSLTPINLMDGSKSSLPIGTDNIANDAMLVDLSYSLSDNATADVSYDLPSVPNQQSKISSIQSSKYLNALEAWTKDIKPYLYRRACIAINSSDRVGEPPEQKASSESEEEYFRRCDKTNNNEALPAKNPIFLKEVLLNVIPKSTSEGHDPIKGTISYNHQFDNKNNIIDGALNENITINLTAPANSIQETPILGRALGPLLFSAGVTNPRKSISIDIVVPKPTGIKGTLMTEPECPLYYNGCTWRTVNQLIEGHAPFSNRTNALFKNAKSQEFGTVFKDSDTENWSPTEGKYSRSVSWIFQQCTTDRFYLDH
jgi:hypothetical protein